MSLRIRIMTSRYSPAKRLNRLPPRERALLSARVLLAVQSGLMDERDAGRTLRAAMGVQWSLLTAIQYLSGQEAIRAIDSLPDDWHQAGLTKGDATRAVLTAGWVCAHGHPGGKPLTSGHLVSAMSEIKNKE